MQQHDPYLSKHPCYGHHPIITHCPPPFSVPAPAGAAPEHQGRPWITYAVICLCTGLWVYLNLAKDWPQYTAVVTTVAPRGFRIWTGAVWGLVTAAFVHFDFWHILFNMWWTKDFGGILEPGMGRRKYLLFILAAAIVSSGGSSCSPARQVLASPGWSMPCSGSG